MQSRLCWDFDVPSCNLGKVGVGGEGKSGEIDPWFLVPHEHLLRPSAETSDPRAERPRKQPTKQKELPATRSGERRRKSRESASKAAVPVLATASSRSRPPRKPRSTASEDDIKEKLRLHNLKLARYSSRSSFEPRHKNTSGIKAWERATGRQYDKLSMRERARANREIDMLS